MIGFYLSINRNTNAPVEVVTNQYDSFITGDNIEENRLYIFQDDYAQKVQLNGYTIFNIGTLIYKNRWGNEALKIIINDLNNDINIQNIMADTRGQFCLIVHTIKNILIITDKIGCIPVYKLEDNSTIHLSNIFLLLAKKNKVTMNYQAFAEYLCFDYCFDCTFFNEIKYLNGSTVYQFYPEVKIHVYDDFLSGMVFNKNDKLEKASHLAKETIENNLSFLSAKDRVFLDITGGFDTRTIAAILKGMKLDFDGGICGEQIIQEAEYAVKVAEKLDVKFHSGIKVTDKRVFRKIVDKQFEITNGIPIFYHSSELINYYEKIKQEYDIHLTGYAGTQLFSQCIPWLSRWSSKQSKYYLYEKQFNYKDIFNKNFLTKTGYYKNLEKKIDNLLEKIGSTVHEEVANYFALFAYSKYWHGSLLGSHDIIAPAYSPYLESNFARVMLETSFKLKDNHSIQKALITELNKPVSLITTSHGYNANYDLKKAKNMFSKFRKFARNLARRVIYQFMFSAKIIRLLNSIRIKIKPQIRPENIQRSFWIDEVNEKWSDDMTIFRLIDRDKLNNWLKHDPNMFLLKAKLVYLNRLINECESKD